MITAVPLIVPVLWTLIFFVLIVAGVVCLVWAVLAAARRPRVRSPLPDHRRRLGYARRGPWGADPVRSMILAVVYLLVDQATDRSSVQSITR
jgi:hypothetical protein